MEGKIIVLSAPSGSGKSTIISRLMKYEGLKLGFSISATSRKPRQNEVHGRDYYFLSIEEFSNKVNNGEFIEWEEVYDGVRYGTLESEITRVISGGNNIIMDIDVKGALNIKSKYGNKALLMFIMPPSLSELEKRLRNRATDSEETIMKRLGKAEEEISFSNQFDVVVLNDNMESAVVEAKEIIARFVTKEGI